MLEKLFESVPLPLVLALAAYAVIAWWFGGVAAERQFGRSQLASCEVGMRAQEAQARRLPADKEAAITALEEMLKWYEQMPGAKAMADIARRQIMAARTPVMPNVNAQERCRCLLNATLRDVTVRTDWALYVGSLRVLEESGVTDFAGHFARKDREGACGKAVMS
jgi:hypothetical protein